MFGKRELRHLTLSGVLRAMLAGRFLHHTFRSYYRTDHWHSMIRLCQAWSAEDALRMDAGRFLGIPRRFGQRAVCQTAFLSSGRMRMEVIAWTFDSDVRMASAQLSIMRRDHFSTRSPSQTHSRIGLLHSVCNLGASKMPNKSLQPFELVGNERKEFECVVCTRKPPGRGCGSIRVH
jgi:hypothetical protein